MVAFYSDANVPASRAARDSGKEEDLRNICSVVVEHRVQERRDERLNDVNLQSFDADATGLRECVLSHSDAGPEDTASVERSRSIRVANVEFRFECACSNSWPIAFLLQQLAAELAARLAARLAGLCRTACCLLSFCKN